MEEQKILNVQTNRKIEAVESSLNRKLDNMHSEISRLSNQQMQGSKKRKVASQSQQHQKGMHEIGSTNDPVPEVEVEVERSPVPDLSPPSLPPPP